MNEKPKNKAWKIVKICLICIGVLLVSAVLFIKFDTAAAAQLTDNVLRPVIGDDRILSLEKTFFNLSDSVDRVTKKAPEVPQFIDQGQSTTLPVSLSNLVLTPIPLNKTLAPLQGEGVWNNHPLVAYPGQEVMADTFTRPDPDRPFAVTTIVQVDSTKISIGSVAGIKQPGGPVGKPGPGVVPSDIIDSGKLIAAFDGGFQYHDGQFGMIVGNTTYLPLKKGQGTIIGHIDGTFNIVNYTGQDLGSDIAFVRQNCPLLIDNGNIMTSDAKNNIFYGMPNKGTVNFYTWRSGIGINKNGNLIFAVGNNLTPTTLATALRSAGAINAMQLDINPTWVRFNIFESLGGGKYSSTPLTKELKDGSKEYLSGYEKDFFYLYQK
jgi:hypothetical protein